MSAVVNSASMNARVHVSFGITVFSSIYPGVGLLGHVTVLILAFKGTSTLFSITAVSLYIPTNIAGGFPFLHSRN